MIVIVSWNRQCLTIHVSEYGINHHKNYDDFTARYKRIDWNRQHSIFYCFFGFSNLFPRGISLKTINSHFFCMCFTSVTTSVDDKCQAEKIICFRCFMQFIVLNWLFKRKFDSLFHHKSAYLWMDCERNRNFHIKKKQIYMFHSYSVR